MLDITQEILEEVDFSIRDHQTRRSAISLRRLGKRVPLREPRLVPPVGYDRPGPVRNHLEAGGSLNHYGAWVTATWSLPGQRVGEIESASIRRSRGADRGTFHLLPQLGEPK